MTTTATAQASDVCNGYTPDCEPTFYVARIDRRLRRARDERLRKWPLLLHQQGIARCVQLCLSATTGVLCTHSLTGGTGRSRAGKFISSSLVADGICDCCDGSDEEDRKGKVLGSPMGSQSTTLQPGASRSTVCKNTCDSEGADWRRAQEERIRKAEDGARLRATYAEAGTKAATTRAAAIAAAAAAIETATAAREAAQATLTAVEDEEAAATARLRAAAEAAEASSGGPDARVASALGLDGLDRAALVALLLEHARATDTGEALAATLQARAEAAATAAGAPAPAADAVRWLADAAAPAVPEVKTPDGDAARAAYTEAAAQVTKLQAEVRGAPWERFAGLLQTCASPCPP